MRCWMDDTQMGVSLWGFQFAVGRRVSECRPDNGHESGAEREQPVG